MRPILEGIPYFLFPLIYSLMWRASVLGGHQRHCFVCYGRAAQLKESAAELRVFFSRFLPWLLANEWWLGLKGAVSCESSDWALMEMPLSEPSKRPLSGRTSNDPGRLSIGHGRYTTAVGAGAGPRHSLRHSADSPKSIPSVGFLRWWPSIWKFVPLNYSTTTNFSDEF